MEPNLEDLEEAVATLKGDLDRQEFLIWTLIDAIGQEGLRTKVEEALLDWETERAGDA